MNLFPKSIALRLTLTLGVVALLVFSAAGLLLHRALANELTRADHEELVGKIKVVSHFVDESRKAQGLDDLRHHMDDLLIGHANVRLWLTSEDGAAVYGGTLPKVTGHPDSRGHFSVVREDGVVMDAVDSALPDASPLPVARVRLAIDTRPRDRLLATYRIVLTGVCALGVLFILGLGGLATWHGLRPVKRLSTEAADITPHSLDVRLSDTHDDAELTGLVDAFNAVLDRLEAAYRQMEAFSADVAHELRTPLATVINGSQVMLSGDRTATELRDALAANLEDLEQMKALINDMLFLARADQGDRAQELEPVDLAAETDKTIEYCEPLIEEAGVSIRREGTATAVCSAALIRRALVNLIVNAIKHTERGGEISVRLDSTAGRVRLSAFNPGPSIPKEIAERMFDRFFRADEARVRTGESHGLGLTIVRAIARMHAGKVFVEPTTHGNRVGLEIPIPPSLPARRDDLS